MFEVSVLIPLVESNSPNILASCATNLNESIDSSNVSVRGYLPLTRKDSVTHMHGLVVYVKEGHPFAWDLRFLICVFH